MVELMSGSASAAYGFAALSYAVFGGYLVVGWRRGAAGGMLLAAVWLSALWTGLTAIYAARGAAGLGLLGDLGDIARQAAWLCFLLVLLRPLGASRRRWPRVAVGLCVLAQLIAVLSVRIDAEPSAVMASFSLGAFLGGGVLGLVLVEQLIRTLPGESRWAMKPFCVGLAAGYVFEIYIFADAFLFGRIAPDVWGVRGAAHALTIPLIAMSAARNPAWTFNIAMSRELVFHSTALAVSGLYLLLIAGAGYYVRYVGGEWGRALQLALIFGGLLLLALFLFSGSQRARLRVFVNKHFFPYRYDYRTEWLRFTQGLGAAGGALGLGQSVVKALADLVESPGGSLWLRDSAGIYVQAGRLNVPGSDATESADGAFCRYLTEREWIIDLEEFRARPAHYADLALPEWLSGIPDAWLVVPLKAGDGLVGFVVLSAPRAPFEIDWEVLDLLKTAQRQAAGYLAQMQMTEALLEARKFDSFNRMSAFVVHDLKNLIAQLSLMLRNAERHAGNPEFQADMLSTVAHVEERMRGLMAQLQEKRSFDPPRRLSLDAIAQSVARAKRGSRPEVPVQIVEEGRLEVMGHPERLERIVGHLVQNAIEATRDEGEVRIRVDRGNGHTARLVVDDNGVGMTREFMRERLFRPFQSSKSGGMGIGVYEAQLYLRELGGDIVYESEPGRGTRVTVTIPLATRSGEAVAAESVSHAS